MRTFQWHRWQVLAGAICILWGTHTNAAQVRIAWDPPTNNVNGTPLTDLAGYKLYYGATSRVYAVTIDVGNVTTALVSNLVEGRTYYFAGKSRNTAGAESDYSAELVWSAPDATPPVITPPAAVTVKVGAISGTKVPDFLCDLKVTDNCTPRASLALTQTPEAGTQVVGAGTTEVVIKATDAAGNQAQVTSSVTVTLVAQAVPSKPLNVVMRLTAP